MKPNVTGLGGKIAIEAKVERKAVDALKLGGQIPLGLYDRIRTLGAK